MAKCEHYEICALNADENTGDVRYSADANTVVHPGSVLEVAIIKVRVPEVAPQTVADVEIEWEISAEDMISVRDKLTIRASDIARAILSRDE